MPIPSDSISPEHLNDLRGRVLNGEEIPPEDYAVVIEALRRGRISAASPTKARGPAAPKAPAGPINLDPFTQ